MKISSNAAWPAVLCLISLREEAVEYLEGNMWWMGGSPIISQYLLMASGDS
jgi:hypothetical protein